MLTPEVLTQVEEVLAGAGPGALAPLRQKFPGVSLTRCDASDVVGELVYRVFGRYDLYLVDGRDHCWRITAEPNEATGFLLAERRG